MLKPRDTPASDLPFPKVPEVVFTNWREALPRSGLSEERIQGIYSLALN